MYILLYFDKTQNVNVNLLISARRLTSTAQNTSTLRFAFRQSKVTDPLYSKSSGGMGYLGL